MNNILLLETNRIKDIMGIMSDNNILFEAATPPDVFSLVKSAVGKAPTMAITKTEQALSQFLNNTTSVLSKDALSLIETNGGKIFMDKLKAEIEKLPAGEERKLYLSKVETINNNYLKTQSFNDLSKKAQTLFSEFNASALFTVNQKNKINKIAKKITSSIPLHNKLNTLQEKEAIDLLKQFNVDFQNTYDELLKLKQQKRNRLTKTMSDQIDFILKLFKNVIDLLTGLIQTFAIKNPKKLFIGLFIIFSLTVFYIKFEWLRKTTIGKWLFDSGTVNDGDLKSDETQSGDENKTDWSKYK